VAAASLLLVHDAGSGPWAFEGWEASFPGVRLHAVDLQAGLVLAEASMENYAAATVAAAGLLEPPVAVAGWGAGGLAAMMAARRFEPAALALLEPSAPAEVQGLHPEIEAAPGLDEAGERPDSALAHAERQRGVSVPALPLPTLVLHGREFPPDRAQFFAEVYGAEVETLPSASHADLVQSPDARSAVLALLARA
jgi:pimeloyl-ACP methyl ester carboxylesterase